MENKDTAMALIRHYCNEKYFNHVANATATAQKKFRNEPVFSVFRAYGALMQGQVRQAAAELDTIKDRSDVSLCSLMALIYAEKKKTTPDREVIRELETKMREDRKSASPQSLYYAGMFLWLLGRNDKAREYTERMIKLTNNTKEGIILKAWIDVTCGKDDYVRKAGKLFDEGLKDGADVFALMGKAQYFENCQNYSEALGVVNKVIASFPGFLPALIKKMTLFLNLQDWEQTTEAAVRVLQMDANNLNALHLLTLHSLCINGDMTESITHLTNLIKSLEVQEPHNPELAYRMSLAFSRVCGRNEMVLEQVFKIVEKAFSEMQGSSDFAAELGYLMLLQGKIKEAVKWYKTAMTLDEMSLTALTGIIWCQLIEGCVEEAEKDLEFLTEVQQTTGKSGEILYLLALVAIKKRRPQEEITKLLKDAVETHFSTLQGLPLTVGYFQKMNPDFLLQIVKEYLALCPSKPSGQGQSFAPQLRHCASLLDTVVRVVPGLLQGVFLQAKVRYQSGNVDAAQNSLQHCLEQCPSHTDAHLLMAQIHLLRGNFTLCFQSLELCLSHNFEIREHPLYLLIKAQAKKKMGELTEAIQILQLAMNLPGVYKAESLTMSKNKIVLSSADCVCVFLELAEALRLSDKQVQSLQRSEFDHSWQEAASVMQDAINKFSGTPEELRVTIANVDLALSQGDTELALNMLRNITPEQLYYIQAKEKMADIFLNHKKDKRLYVSCYREIVDKIPSPHTYVLLGEAYMHILEPEKAIEVYEHALEKTPEDGALVSKFGKFLIKTHYFDKALHYYEAALKTGHQNFLRYDLAELLMKMKQYERCESVLHDALSHKPVNGLGALSDDCRCLMLLAKVQNRVDKAEEALISLQRARDVQARVLKRVQLEQPDSFDVQKQLAAKICTEIAQHYTSQRVYDKAIEFYKESLSHCETDHKVMLELAQVFFILDDIDACQEQCSVVLRNDHFNKDATLMMANLMFRRKNDEQALFHYRQLLECNPDDFSTVSRLIDLLKKAGKLDEMPRFFERLENNSTRLAFDPGFHYCKGLYFWYTGQPNAALHHFNQARKDTKLGQNAVHKMIEIYLNFNNDIMGVEISNLDLRFGTTEKQEMERISVTTAHQLLKEIKPETPEGHLKLHILENYCLLATKQEVNIKKAHSVFTELATNVKGRVPALLGIATASMMLKQMPQARNQLKHITKMIWNIVDAEEFEKSWLLLANIYIHSGKYDLADDLLKRCLNHNKSCCKAYEYRGFIMENEQAFCDAAFNYKLAWKYGNQFNPTVGYKLALNYLKAKQNFDAIDVCHKVLATHPNFSKIRIDILDKACAALRP
ncbi:tetratricopeptide repeat protein 21B-like isoform X2 [Corythoichthys intestinalis]|uniref:tetratricopeptide repeat protein 21B-like isoform X2 n=1 Tax=Corythoichthys intestinalis TaxID=161448 RepID=UPI0025A5DE88|nr:tetratricopeptide repeat protein 21B-like isoform X2 [Corythoichthys intestinalis]